VLNYIFIQRGIISNLVLVGFTLLIIKIMMPGSTEYGLIGDGQNITYSQRHDFSDEHIKEISENTMKVIPEF